MPEKVSRRQFARTFSLGAAAVVAPGLVGAAQGQEKTEQFETALAEIDAQLHEKLSDEARKIAQENLAGSRRVAKGRLAVKLPENSEPCTLFFASSKDKTR